jgi:hypothetical protein
VGEEPRRILFLSGSFMFKGLHPGWSQAGQTKKKLVISMVLCEYLLALKQQRAG